MNIIYFIVATCFNPIHTSSTH